MAVGRQLIVIFRDVFEKFSREMPAYSGPNECHYFFHKRMVKQKSLDQHEVEEKFKNNYLEQ